MTIIRIKFLYSNLLIQSNPIKSTTELFMQLDKQTLEHIKIANNIQSTVEVEQGEKNLLLLTDFKTYI